MGNLPQHITVISLNHHCIEPISPFSYHQQQQLRQILLNNMVSHGSFQDLQNISNLLSKERYSVLFTENCGIIDKKIGLMLAQREEFEHQWNRGLAKLKDSIESNKNNGNDNEIRSDENLNQQIRRVLEFDWVWYTSVVEFVYGRRLAQMTEEQLKNVQPLTSYLKNRFNSSPLYCSTGKLIQTIKLIQNHDVTLLQDLSALQFDKIMSHLDEKVVYSTYTNNCAIFLRLVAFQKIHSSSEVFKDIPHYLIEDSKIYDMAVLFADNVVIVSALDSYWAQRWIEQLLKISGKQNQLILGCCIRQAETQFQLMQSLCKKMKQNHRLKVFPGNKHNTALYTRYSLYSGGDPIRIKGKSQAIVTTLEFKDKFLKLGDRKVAKTDTQLPGQSHPYLHYVVGGELVKYHYDC